MSGNNDEFYVGSVPNERHTFNSIESSLGSYMATILPNSSLTTQKNNLPEEPNNLQKKINSEDESVNSEDSSTGSEDRPDDESNSQSTEEELQFTIYGDDLQFTEDNLVKISGDYSKINKIIHQPDDY